MRTKQLIICVVISLCGIAKLAAQPEWRPWNNIAGLHVEGGQLMPFETSLRAVDPDWGGYVATDKYNKVSGGKAEFAVEELSYITLINN